MTEQDKCPCDSGAPFSGCCGPLLEGSKHAPTAAALMRSRYSAYVTKNTEHLLRTWHPSTRPGHIAPHSIPQWTHLEVINEKEDKETGEARVEFKARALSSGQVLVLHEISRFVKENNLWFYIDGEIKDAPKSTAVKIGRNSPCPCGSGKKFKKCCGP
ncbi:MAG: YchJ family metal-binding protein [Pseudomonadota bacterium]